MNAIGGDMIEMLRGGVAEAEQNFEALVVGTEAPAFSAGANLMLVLLEAQEENWDEIDMMVESFQSAVVGLRYATVPVVVAPAGLTLGGGCEVTLHADRVQAAAETYMGQVEVGVGLVPAGGGTKELLVRSMDQKPDNVDDPLPFVRLAFELIGFAKVSDEWSGRETPRTPAGRRRHHDESRAGACGRQSASSDAGSHGLPAASSAHRYGRR